MKISIITVVKNNKETIKDTINSVLNQTYKDIEYIIIDGASIDGTIEIIKSYGGKVSMFISEPDKGLYDAMNKGIALAGGDIVGILNSDDFYINNNVIEKVIKEFKDKKCDSVYADLVYVKPENLDNIVRYYDSSKFNPSKFAYGWMPAHPTFFVKREIYEKYGVFKTNFKISADFDILARFLYTHKISYYYMSEVIVKMRIGGVSTSLNSLWINNIETLRACRNNGIKTNIFKILSKYPVKVIGLFKR